MCDLASEETSVESMSELLDELERVRDRQEKIIALLRKSTLVLSVAVMCIAILEHYGAPSLSLR
jgi:hypothetical protein